MADSRCSSATAKPDEAANESITALVKLSSKNSSSKDGEISNSSDEEAGFEESIVGSHRLEESNSSKGSKVVIVDNSTADAVTNSYYVECILM